MTTKLEQIGAKAVGAAKVAIAAATGLTGIFRRLAQEHGEVAALIARVRASSDPNVRREVFPTIRKALLAHEDMESREVYAVFQQHEETRDIAEAHEHEADALRALIETVNDIAVDDSSWGETFDRLATLVSDHAKREESEFFPIGQRLFGNRADEMLERYEKLHARATRELNRTP